MPATGRAGPGRPVAPAVPVPPRRASRSATAGPVVPLFACVPLAACHLNRPLSFPHARSPSRERDHRRNWNRCRRRQHCGPPAGAVVRRPHGELLSPRSTSSGSSGSTRRCTRSSASARRAGAGGGQRRGPRRRARPAAAGRHPGPDQGQHRGAGPARHCRLARAGRGRARTTPSWSPGCAQAGAVILGQGQPVGVGQLPLHPLHQRLEHARRPDGQPARRRPQPVRLQFGIRRRRSPRAWPRSPSAPRPTAASSARPAPAALSASSPPWAWSAEAGIVPISSAPGHRRADGPHRGRRRCAAVRCWPARTRRDPATAAARRPAPRLHGFLDAGALAGARLGVWRDGAQAAGPATVAVLEPAAALAALGRRQLVDPVELPADGPRSLSPSSPPCMHEFKHDLNAYLAGAARRASRRPRRPHRVQHASTPPRCWPTSARNSSSRPRPPAVTWRTPATWRTRAEAPAGPARPWTARSPRTGWTPLSR